MNIVALKINGFRIHAEGGLADGTRSIQHVLRIKIKQAAAAALSDAVDIGAIAGQGLHQPFHDVERHRLGPDLHIAPAGKIVVGQIDIAVADGV